MAKERVLLLDTTLRDGEQSAGIGMTGVEKMEIARQLQKMQVDIIEAGFAASSPGDFEAVTNIAKEIDGPIIASLARAVSDDVEQAARAVEHSKRPRIHVFLSSSEIHQMHQLRKNREDVLEMAISSVTKAKGYCDDVEFSPMDATRTNPEYLFHMLEEVIKAGATTINIADTVGYAIPSATGFGQLLKDVQANVKGIENVTLSVHCHNDLGLAVANSLIAVEFGARQVEGCINGIGERAGNAAMEEIVMAINTRPDTYVGLRVDIRTQELAKSSRIVSRLTGYPVQYNKAVVGRNAFAHEAGIHQHGVLNERTTYEIMDPAAVGQGESKLVLGKHSGRAAFRDALQKLGHDIHGDALNAAFTRFKELADRKVQLNDADLEALAIEEIGGRVEHVYEFVSLDVRGGTATTPTADLVMRVAGEEVAVTCEGDGMVDASCSAVKVATGAEGRMTDYNVTSVTGGVDALADVALTFEGSDGVKVSGRGLSTDVVEASTRAFIGALNKIARIRESGEDPNAVDRPGHLG